MKKYFLSLIITILLSSCGASLQTIVDHNAIPKPFENPLIVIPYTSQSFSFSKNLKNNIELKFQAEDQKIEILFLHQESNTLTLNSNDSFEDKVNYAIINDDKDIVFIFKTTGLRYYNSSLESIDYEVVGIETNNFKEVWKGTMYSSSTVGPSLFANKCAELLYDKLKIDGVL